MTDTGQPQDDDDDPIEPATVTLKRSDIRALERKAKAAEDATAKVASLERQLAFLEAGINPTDPKLKYFTKGYDGDMTADAIKAAATEAGFLEAPKAPEVPPDELAAMTRSTAVTAGAQNPGASADQAFRAALASASTPDQVMAVVEKFGIPTSSDT